MGISIFRMYSSHSHDAALRNSLVATVERAEGMGEENGGAIPFLLKEKNRGGIFFQLVSETRGIRRGMAAGCCRWRSGTSSPGHILEEEVPCREDGGRSYAYVQ